MLSCHDLGYPAVCEILCKIILRKHCYSGNIDKCMEKVSGQSKLKSKTMGIFIHNSKKFGIISRQLYLCSCKPYHDQTVSTHVLKVKCTLLGCYFAPYIGGT